MQGFLNKMFYSRTYSTGKRMFLNLYPFIVIFALFNFWYSCWDGIEYVARGFEKSLLWTLKAVIIGGVSLFLLYLLIDAFVSAKNAIKEWWRQIGATLLAGIVVAIPLLVIALIGQAFGWYEFNWTSKHTIYWIAVALLGRYIGFGLNRNFTQRAIKGVLPTGDADGDDDHDD